MNFIIVHNVFLLLVIIVIKAIQPDCYKIKGSSVLLLETPLTRSKYISPYTHAQHLTRTSRTFYTFAYKQTLQRSGTYQLRLMVLYCRTNSLMVSSLVLCSSTVGVVAWSIAFCTCSGFSSLSTHCAMALVWTPILFSVDIPFWVFFVCLLLFFGVYVYLSEAVLTLSVVVSNCSLL